MSNDPKSFQLSPEIHAYMIEHGSPPDAVQLELIEETRRLGGVSLMQIAPEQGAFMTLLTRLLGARRAVEVGTFTGYSSLCIARGLSEEGTLITCDVSEEWTSIARRFWEKAGVADKIDLRLGPAVETLHALPQDEPLDLGFIDADKTGYADYYEAILERLRPGGVILVDNVLWFGNVVNPDADDDGTRAIRAFNDKVAADERVDRVMLAISDGLTIVRKR
ncbi:MAG: class I SAM-dependent methyltransferase [Deltaproteobacteria bacterium]|nr:class I SAM-dependent methyltransferase [Deltaproteobacteria bacterium]